jgi:hypothetical protein
MLTEQEKKEMQKQFYADVKKSIRDWRTALMLLPESDRNKREQLQVQDEFAQKLITKITLPSFDEDRAASALQQRLRDIHRDEVGSLITENLIYDLINYYADVIVTNQDTENPLIVFNYIENNISSLPGRQTVSMQREKDKIFLKTWLLHLLAQWEDRITKKNFSSRLEETTEEEQQTSLEAAEASKVHLDVATKSILLFDRHNQVLETEILTLKTEKQEMREHIQKLQKLLDDYYQLFLTQGDLQQAKNTMPQPAMTTALPSAENFNRTSDKTSALIKQGIFGSQPDTKQEHTHDNDKAANTEDKLLKAVASTVQMMDKPLNLTPLDTLQITKEQVTIDTRTATTTFASQSQAQNTSIEPLPPPGRAMAP